jgi:nucleoside-diphosphate-sugar epimerase
MQHRIFLAGATGVIGRRLAPLLASLGHEVIGMSRSSLSPPPEWARNIRFLRVDVFDADSVKQAILEVRPDVLIHQLTDLSKLSDPAAGEEAIRRNARIRIEGTRNLIAAALAANVQRVVAQSVAWAYAPGPLPHSEAAPLDVAAVGPRSITVNGVMGLEDLVLHSRPIEGFVLRYGQLYGPDTGRDTPDGTAPLHVDAAAIAACLAMDRGKPGAFNIADSGGSVLTTKARTELGWSDLMRLR